MEHYLEQLNLTEMMEELDGFFPDKSLDLWGMFERILAGNWKEAGEMAWQGLFGSVLEQAAGMKGLLASLLILGMLSVLISCFLASFENHQIAQIAHYIFLSAPAGHRAQNFFQMLSDRAAGDGGHDAGFQICAAGPVPVFGAGGGRADCGRVL